LDQHNVGFNNLQIQVSLENRKAFSLMIWARTGGIMARVSFKPTTPRASPTQDRGAAPYHILARLASRQPSDGDVWDRDHFLSLSLSSDYKEENVGRSLLLFTIFPIAKVRYRHPLTTG
jgi:hypothetical protein